MKWTEEQTVNFVKEFVKHECLYNVNCDEYRNKYYRKAALVKLSAYMLLPGFGPKDAYLKIRSLKATYFQQIKKIKDRSDAGTGYVYTPKLKWFTILHDALNRLNRTEACLETDINIDTVHPPEYYKIEEDLVQIDSDSNEESNNNSGSGCLIIDESNPNMHMSTNVNNKRKITLRDYSNLLTKVQCTSSRSNTPVEHLEHEFDIFGKSIAAQLKNMPLDRAIEAQMFIQNYLSDMRLRALQRNAYTPRSTSSQSDYKMS